MSPKWRPFCPGGDKVNGITYALLNSGHADAPQLIPQCAVLIFYSISLVVHHFNSNMSNFTNDSVDLSSRYVSSDKNFVIGWFSACVTKLHGGAEKSGVGWGEVGVAQILLPLRLTKLKNNYMEICVQLSLRWNDCCVSWFSWNQAISRKIDHFESGSRTLWYTAHFEPHWIVIDRFM